MLLTSLLVVTSCAGLPDPKLNLPEISKTEVETFEFANVKIPPKDAGFQIPTDQVYTVQTEQGPVEYVYLTIDQVKKLAELLEERKYSIDQLDAMQERFNNMAHIANKQAMLVYATEDMARKLKEIALIQNQLYLQAERARKFEVFRGYAIQVIMAAILGIALF